MASNQKGHGQGRVTDPQNDGRMKQSNNGNNGSSNDGRGQVKDPKNDGRLKENRS